MHYFSLYFFASTAVLNNRAGTGRTLSGFGSGLNVRVSGRVGFFINNYYGFCSASGFGFDTGNEFITTI